MICKTFKQKEAMRKACRAAATVLDRLCGFVAPGVTTLELDEEGGRLMNGFGVTSACKGYRAGSKVFPAYTCLSVNDEIVHGIGRPNKRLKEGDVISVDVCIRCEGYIGDNCRTVAVGRISPELERLLKVTEEAMYLGISRAVHKGRVGDVSSAVQTHAEAAGYGIVTNFVGHGVGQSLHEEPQIPNFGKSGSGPKFKKGMTVCIEPMVNMKDPKVRMGPDGWTALTMDGLPSAHFEHTVLIEDGQPEILTVPEGRESPEKFRAGPLAGFANA